MSGCVDSNIGLFGHGKFFQSNDLDISVNLVILIFRYFRVIFDVRLFIIHAKKLPSFSVITSGGHTKVQMPANIYTHV